MQEIPATVQPETLHKYHRLQELLRGMGRVAIAYSGGVDSAFLARVAHDVLTDNAYAVLGVSPTVARSELEDARKLAEEFGFSLVELETNELSNPDYSSNPTNRCYYCKTELFQQIRQWGEKEGVFWICDGSNVDDRSDWRPGSLAAQEKSVRSPLAETGLTKEEIRSLSQMLGLPTWDKPSIACLGSRFPYGSTITLEALGQLDKAEDLLRGLGFRQLRVRHHGDTARIELEAADIPRMIDADIRSQVVDGFRKLGYQFVTLDLAGYRTGSMNVHIQDNSKDK